MSSADVRGARLPRTIRPLRHPAYRRLAGNLACSVLAEGLWVVAVVWQVIDLGGGASTFSAVSGALALGLVVTALLGGVLADRWSQRRILLAVGAVQLASVGLVAALSLAGTLAPATLVGVAAVVGMAGGLSFPAYSALLPRLVPADELQAVNGLEGTLRPSCSARRARRSRASWSPRPGRDSRSWRSPPRRLGALLCAWALRRRRPALETDRPRPNALADLREGFRYMVVTRWLLVTHRVRVA